MAGTSEDDSCKIFVPDGPAGTKVPAQYMEALRAGVQKRVGFSRLSCTEAGIYPRRIVRKLERKMDMKTKTILDMIPGLSGIIVLPFFAVKTNIGGRFSTPTPTPTATFTPTRAPTATVTRTLIRWVPPSETPTAIEPRSGNSESHNCPPGQHWDPDIEACTADGAH